MSVVTRVLPLYRRSVADLLPHHAALTSSARLRRAPVSHRSRVLTTRAADSVDTNMPPLSKRIKETGEGLTGPS
eukprot:9407963-Pyramimonas_sp.AAC.1